MIPIIISLVIGWLFGAGMMYTYIHRDKNDAL